MRCNAIPEYDPVRLLSKIDKTDNCWIWIGEVSRISGYGRFYIMKRPYAAHRVVYDYFVGISDLDKVIDHTCMNKKCVNPSHLREVNVATNVIENSKCTAASKKMQTHCKHGHEFTAENTIISKKSVYGGVWRNCRECKRRIARDSARKGFSRKKSVQ